MESERRSPRSTPGTARVEFTAAQIRMVNAALAFLEAEDHDDTSVHDGYRQDVMDNTRTKVFRAMERAGVEP